MQTAAAKPAAVQFCPLRDPNAFRCFGWLRTDLTNLTSTNGGIPTNAGYTPGDIQAAYNLDPSLGAGQTVAIVDAYGYSTAASDLASYRKAAGLPPCRQSDGCLRILNQNGQPRPLPAQPSTTSSAFGWVFEQSLDLDAVSAVCPKCKIVLIQAKGANSKALYAAVVTAAKFAPIVSMSWGAREQGSPTPRDFFNRGNHVLVASAGDQGGGAKNGGGPQIPCVYASVVCVGGTYLAHSGGVWSESVWNDNASLCPKPCGATNSGCSRIVKKPAWQTDRSCKARSAVDVAADASVFSAFAVYNSNFVRPGSSSPWAGAGGTSLSAPIIAGVVALAGNATNFGAGASRIWNDHSALRDVVSGTNIYAPVTGPCISSVAYICVAKAGYDGPTGWGTPNGSGSF